MKKRLDHKKMAYFGLSGKTLNFVRSETQQIPVPQHSFGVLAHRRSSSWYSLIWSKSKWALVQLARLVRFEFEL